jgi:hypothetical protein
MSDRLLGGAMAAVAAVLTLMQLVWMFGMFSPASVAGHDGSGYATLLAAWFFVTLSPLAATAIILLMTENDPRG